MNTFQYTPQGVCARQLQFSLDDDGNVSGVSFYGGCNGNLKAIGKLTEGMEARFRRHRALGSACKAAMAALGLGQVPVSAECAANTMTAPRYPAGVSGNDLLPRVKAAGAILAGGLHPAIRAEYFRIGHMGTANAGDLLATVNAIEAGLAACGYAFEPGTGVTAAVRTLALAQVDLR